MSEHLKMARNSLNSAAEFLDSRGLEIAALRDHQQAIWSLLQHALESQPQTPSERSSSPDTGTPEETSAGWSTSFESWCRVNLDGTLTLFPPESIWVSVSSLFGRGNWPEGEIGVTLTSKAATPPSGSASSSPVEEVSQASGHAGEHDWRHFDMRNPERSY